jgi:hypothetical protein
MAPLKIDLTVTDREDTQSREQAETKTGVDLDALAQVINTTVRSAVSAAMATQTATMGAGGGMGVTGWATTVGALLTAATTGYLAVKKREQIRQDPPRRRAPPTEPA